MRVLAVADEVSEELMGDALHRLRPDLIVSSGDLPFDYLENLVSRSDKPLLYVPGNHDPDLRPPDPWSVPLAPDHAGIGPQGCENVDGRIVAAAGIVVCGLGGSIRYRPGAVNQYTEGQLRARALRLELRVRLRRALRGRGVDILLAHSPPRDCGDSTDPSHRGFAAFHDFARRVKPRLLVHGHVHGYGRRLPDRQLGRTLVVNAVPYRLLEL